MKKWSVCICNVLNSMENLNIRDTKRKEILPKKNSFQFLMKMPATPTRPVFFPK